MTEAAPVLAIDQGTTSSRAILFDGPAGIAALSQQPFAQHLPRSGWVEHDPELIWQTTCATCRAVLDQAAGGRTIAALGIANQRETTVLWDRKTGAPLHKAIVWQDRRTDAICRRLKADGHEAMVTDKTGLVLDPYFSATKIAWLLDTIDGARARAARGELCFGTIDSFLIWRLTDGAVHATDATNASRTLLYNIHDGCWDDDLCRLFDVPAAILPEVRDSMAGFGTVSEALFGRALPILGVAGDQQAATIGQACFRPGMMKATYGTGCFALLNTGLTPVRSKHRLLTTIAYRIGGDVAYALEGAIFIAGAAVQWLRDGLGLIDHAADSQALAKAADPEQAVYLVPAFTGLGAPWWDATCRGALHGLTRATGPAELARAALESVAYQTLDLWHAMQGDWPGAEGAGDPVLRVDGGMTASDWTLQCLADMLRMPVDRPAMTETTALGAAWLAGHGAGAWPDAAQFAKDWALETRFTPTMPAATAAEKYAGWQDALRRTLSA